MTTVWHGCSVIRVPLESKSVDEEERVPPQERSFPDASFACPPLSPFPFFPPSFLCFTPISFPLFWLLSDVFHQINSRLRVLFLRSVCIISFIIQVALKFHFIPPGGPYTYRSLVCSLSSLFRPSATLLYRFELSYSFSLYTVFQGFLAQTTCHSDLRIENWTQRMIQEWRCFVRKSRNTF